MAHNFGGFSSYTDGPVPAADGGHGSGVPARHHVEVDNDNLSTEHQNVVGIDKKRFTERLHSRKEDGKFEPSSMKHNEAKSS